MTAPMRIAMLTYSVKPRGGVVHALEVSEALARRGQHVELVALARPGEVLFRPTRLPLALIPHEAGEIADFDRRIEAMTASYVDGLAPILEAGRFDVVHSQDCLSANAVLELRDRGVVDRVVRTVHHVDDFTSPSLIECQHRSIVGPDHVLCVSDPWVARLAREFGVEAQVVPNGVDRSRFRPARDPAERAADRRRLDLGDRLAVLTVGGIEPRKGSLTLLEGFARLRAALPERDPVLLIAGGTTLFDYQSELERFAAREAQLGVGAHVRVLGPQTPQEIERLYRAADLFAFPSVKEGFGLAALEALAAELPVVASDIAVFRGFLEDGRSALLAPTGDGEALGDALVRLAVEPALRRRLATGGRAVAAAYSWDASAARHERVYRSFAEARREAA